MTPNQAIVVKNGPYRKRFTSAQLNILENSFQQAHYLTTDSLEYLRSRLDLSLIQIKIWFRDRRRKWRKMVQHTSCSNDSKPWLSATTASELDHEQRARHILEHQFPPNQRITTDNKRIRRLKIVDLACTQAGCDIRLRTKAELNRHLICTHRVKPFPCRALGCKASFLHGYQLAGHTYQAHVMMANGGSSSAGPVRPLWRCPHCAKDFRCSSHLRIHMVRLHEEGSFACAYEGCSYIAPRFREELKRHVYREHAELKFVCGYEGCEKRFKTKSNAQMHRSTHPYMSKQMSTEQQVILSHPKHTSSSLPISCMRSFEPSQIEQVEHSKQKPLDLSVKWPRCEVEMYRKEEEIKDWIKNEQECRFSPPPSSPTPSVKLASSILTHFVARLQQQTIQSCQ